MYRILMIHNYYQQWGGEDASAEADVNLLRNNGHDVQLFVKHNDEIKHYNILRYAGLFFKPSWSLETTVRLKSTIKNFKPDIVHVQNFFPLVSPALFHTCSKYNIPVVYTLRDYRLFCATGNFLRNNVICEDCVKHSLARSILHRCYHDSAIQTSSVVLMLYLHRFLKTWERKVDAYIALTQFSRDKFTEMGLDPGKIFVRPNFVSLAENVARGKTRNYALFVGRLSPEKGLEILLEAFNELSHFPLWIVGDGPMKDWIDDYIGKYSLSNVKLLGFKGKHEIIDLLTQAKFLIMPSLWYETFGRTIIEAYAAGTPVIASRLGAMADNVIHGKTGMLFTPGDKEDLVRAIKYALDNENEMVLWSRNAFNEYLNKFTPEKAYGNLIDIYDKIIETVRKR